MSSLNDAKNFYRLCLQHSFFTHEAKFQVVPYLFEYNAQNFVLIVNQKLRVRVIDANCSVVLEMCRNYFGEL